MRRIIGHPSKPVTGEFTFVSGETREAVFFGADAFGNQIVHFPQVIGGIKCIPDKVNRGDGKLVGWAFEPDLPEWPGGFPRVNHGRIISTRRRDDWKESWTQTWVLNPETLLWEGGERVY